MDLTRSARTLLRQMADESPRLDLGDPSTTTGLSAAALSRTLRELCAAGYATELQRRPGTGRDTIGLFGVPRHHGRREVTVDDVRRELRGKDLAAGHTSPS